MLRRFVCFVLLSLVAFGTADIASFYRKTNNTNNKHDAFNQIIVAPDQSAYVIGTYYTNNPNQRYIHFRKMSPTGVTLWTNNNANFGETGDLDISIAGIACDQDGNLYFAGRRYDPLGGYRSVLYKYNADGGLAWTRSYAPFFDEGEFTALSIDGDLITLVWSGPILSSYTRHLIQYNPQGELVNQVPELNPASSNDRINRLIRYNNQFFTGGTHGDNAIITRYGANLQRIDSIEYQVPNDDQITVDDMKISPDGHIVLFGSLADNGIQSAMILAYDQEYTLLFDDFVAGAFSSGKRFYRGKIGIIGGELCAVGVGEAGLNSLTKSGIVRAVKLPSGSPKWLVNYNPGATGAGRDVAIDPWGNVWWTGETTTGGQSGVVTQRLIGGSGIPGSTYFENGNGNGEDLGGGLAIDAAGEVRVSGGLTLSGTGMDGVYWHFIETPQCINDVLDTPNAVPFELDVFANDRYVSPRATFSFPSLPANGTVAMNAEKTRIVYTPNAGYSGPDQFTYKVQRGALFDTATVTLTVKRMLTRVSADRNPIAGQNQTLGRVFMSTPASVGGDVVAISDNSSLITTPTSVTVPAGSSTAIFVIQVAPVNTQQIRSVFATHAGITREVQMILDPLIPTAISFSPNPVGGGNTTSCKVVINGVAGPGGRTIAIIDNSAYCTVPSTVVVPAGAGSVTFNITTTKPPTQQVVTVIARVTAGEKSATLRINP